MKRICRFLGICLLLQIGSFTSRATASLTQELRSKVVENPDSVIEILDRIEISEEPVLADFQINLLRSLAYNEKRMFSLVQKFAKDALASDSINMHPKEHANALTLLAGAQRFFGDFQGSIATSTRAMNLARETGNLPAELITLLTMAETSFEMGDRERGYGYINQIIEQGGNSQEARVLANVSAAYGVKIINLFEEDKFLDGLNEGYKRLSLIERIDKNGGAPDGFTDQQRAYTYARIASCAEMLGRRQEAEKAYNDFMATTYAGNPIGRAYITDYLLASKKWNTVLDFTHPLFPIMAVGDTINDDYVSLLSSNAQAFAGLGKFREAYGFSCRASGIKDSLNIRENTAKARELATIFALNEQQLKLERTNSKLQRRNILIISSIGIAVFLLIIIALLFNAYRMKKEQHKIASDRIDELLNMNKLTPVMPEEEEEGRSQFIRMQQQLINSDLFSNPSFNRERIVEVSGLSRNKVIQLIDKYTGMTPGEYINKLRVEHAAMLIQEHPDWSIDAIAETSGYIRRATFYNHFSKIFGITPAQYRESKLKEIKPEDENKGEERGES
ncbi:MAG: helix-turn-helix domain-containing protein [Muribaculaceae bacterium]|nr:helix-turn-helix domain-containing protein [Muribaculaceae bacterium]MDE6754555.1 helix-turn-helix domain-containing protein [Muribaculaceae bacterium]